MKNIIEQEVGGILDDILEDYKKGRAVDKMDIYNQPDKAEIMDILDSLFSIVYPGFFRDKTHKIYNVKHTVSTMIEDVMFHLNKQICVVLKYTHECNDCQEAIEEFAQNATVSFMKRIPKVREYLETDLQAAYDGDPAARSKDEIISPVVQFCWWIEHVSDAARVSIDPGLAVGRYSPLRCEHRPDMAHPRVFSVVG
jgi:serine O-acetyltransferase